VPLALIALAACEAGREDDAIRHAQEALEIRDPAFLLYFSRYFPCSTRLYAFPRFRELLSEAGFE
jgi:hypothetical protein